jgi:hypothetical protein
MVRRQLRIAAGALALATAAVWWSADGDDGVAVAPAAATAATPVPGVAEASRSEAPEDVTSLHAALIAAAARVCADGCEETPAAEPAPGTAVLAQVAPLPADLDAWSLTPEPAAATAEQTAARQDAPSPRFNTPPVPDEHDATPADESNPYAPPAEEPAVE